MPDRFSGFLKFGKKKSSQPAQPSTSASTLATSSTPVQKDTERRSEILASIRTVLNLAEKCLDGCPIWGPKAAVAAMSESIETVQKQLDNEESISDIAELVQKTVEMLNPSTAISLPTSVSPTLQSRISTHISELKRIRASTAKWTKTEKNLPRRLLDARRIATELESVMEQIRQANELFIMENTVTMVRKAEDIQEGVKVIRKDMVDARDQALLALLRPVTEAFHDTSNAPTPCLEGTRKQLISDIFMWFNNRDPSGEHVFWLNGLAGTGKSAVARTVADHAQEQGRLAATFFFSRNSVVTRAPSTIIPTIMYQLARHLPSIRSLTCAAVDSDPHIRDRGVAAQAKTLLEHVSRTTISDGPFLVVLDALDECYFENDRQGGDAVPMLLNKFKSLGCIKFLITSRDEGPIRRMFDTIQSKVALHDIEKSIVQSDIHHYLQYSFAELAHNRKLAPPFPPVRDLEELVRRAGSLFVYAATVAKWISAEPLLRLQQVLEKNKDEEPYQHKFLDGMYSEVLSEAAKTSSNPEKHERALKNVISTVVLLQEPVRVSALAILAGAKDRTDGLLALLSAVLLVDETAPVRLFHPSFPEFVLSAERCRDERFLVGASEGHLHLAARCLDVMNMHLKENICNITDPSLLNNEVHLLQHTLDRVAPAELRYACKYWHTHLRLADVTTSGLVDGLNTFCTTHLLHWLELLSLLNELPTAQTGMPLLLAYLRSSSERVPTSLVVLLADTKQLLSEYRAAVEGNALHVYQSAAVTMPVCPLWEGQASKAAVRAYLRTPRARGWIPHSLILEGHTMGVRSVAFSPDGRSIVSGLGDGAVRVWDASTGAERHTIHGHEDSVNSVAFSPNSQFIVSGSSDETVRVWDTNTGAERHTMHGHKGWVLSVAFSPNGQFIVSGSVDNTVRVWDATTGTERHVMHGHKVNSIAFSPNGRSIASGLDDIYSMGRLSLYYAPKSGVLSVDFSPNGQSIVSGSDDNTVRMWNVATGTERHTMLGHKGWVQSVAFSPNGQFIVSGSVDNTVRVWDATTGTERHTIHGHEDRVLSVAFSPNGRSIASGSDDKTVRVWDANTGAERHIMHGHEGIIFSVAFSPDGQSIVSGSHDKTVRVWDATTGAELHTMHGHEDYVGSIAFSPDGQLIVSGSKDKMVRLWDAATGTERHTMHGHKDWVSCVAFSPDSQSIVSGSSDNTLRVWDATTGTERHTMHGHEDYVRTVAFSPDGQFIVGGSSDNTVCVWDATTGTERHTMYGHKHEFNSVAFSPNGQSIVSGSDDKTVCVWDATTGAERHIMHGHEGWVWSVDFSPDGQSIVSGSDDRTVRVWDASTGTERHTMHGHEGIVFSVAFSPDGRSIVSGSQDKTVRMWDASTGTEWHVMHGHEGIVLSVAFSPDGQSIVSGSLNNTLRVWDASMGTERHVMHGHEHWVSCVAFSPDSQSIVSGSSDNTLRVWDATTGTERHTMHGHEDYVRTVAFSPDGQLIVSGSEDKTVRVWDAATGTERHTMYGHAEPVWSVAFSPDGQSIVSRSRDSTVRVWDASTGMEQPAMPDPFEADSTGWIWSVAANGTRQRLCWLPKHYRGENIASHGQTVCIGAENGAITILDFSNVPFSYE